MSLPSHAFLRIDDIQDNSKLRRGVPVAHSVYGTPITINSANYLYFLAQQNCLKLGNAEALHHFVEEMIHLHWGQGFELYWRENFACPTHEDYTKMVLDKTGGLVRLAVRLMQVFSDDKRDFIPLVNDFAVYFQIRDDLLNLTASDELHKTVCEDLSEGKFSYPIIHAILSRPQDHRLTNIMKRRTEDVAIKQYAVEYMRLAGSFDYTRDTLSRLMSTLRTRVADFGGNAPLEQVLHQLVVAPVLVPNHIGQPPLSARYVALKLSQNEPDA